MIVQVDNVWATKSTLHMRVTVLDNDGRWRHRYYPAVPLAEIPVEAVAPLVGYFSPGGEDERQIALFDW